LLRAQVLDQVRREDAIEFLGVLLQELVYLALLRVESFFSDCRNHLLICVHTQTIGSTQLEEMKKLASATTEVKDA
jgi:hypothetical protein